MVDRARTVQDHLASVLRMRAEAVDFLKEAIAAGKDEEARQWAVELRKINEMISAYGADGHV